MPAHTHAIDHDHPYTNTTGASADHTQAARPAAAARPTRGRHGRPPPQRRLADAALGCEWHDHRLGALGHLAVAPTISAGAALTDTVYPGATGAESADHTHAFTTGGRSADHVHGFDVPAYSGTSGSGGGAAAHNNLPPYIAMPKIIKT